MQGNGDERERSSPLKRRLQGVRKRSRDRQGSTSAVMASKMAVLEDRRRLGARR